MTKHIPTTHEATHSSRRWRLPSLPIRSLMLKLALGFLVVGLTGTLLVAFFVWQRTQQAFDQFVADRGRTTIVSSLTQYYRSNGSWNGVSAFVAADAATRAEQNSQNNQPPAPVVLVDEQLHVVIGDGPFVPGNVVSSSQLDHAIPLQVEGQVVGWLLSGFGPKRFGPGTPEADLLQRITQALIYGAVGATAIALLLGIMLARTMTRPIRELTVATQAVAKGDLGQHVLVRSRDEIGALASSFNQMSTDLERASMLRRQMTADIAHDLRTPLSVILGYTEALRDEKLDGSQEIYESMYVEALHLQHLIDDLRTLSLADAGELSLVRQPTSPKALLERTAVAHSAQAQDLGIQVEVKADHDLPLIDVDPERMAQVLGNLVGNALRYTPAGGRITLAAESAPASVQFVVEDTGEGIDAEALPHIFERFYRVDSSRQQNGSSGLGLAIARSIIEAHGGAINVASARGEGTTFSLLLPMASISSVE